jgi:hypothetical protein
MRCRNDEVSLKGLKVKASNDFYTFAISSLDDKPISDSSNLLITAVGRADNKGARYNGDHTQQIDAGEGPMMIEVIQADIALDTSLESARILAMNYDGFLAGTSVVDIKDGKMQFSIGDCWQNSSMYYLIQSD